MNKHFFYGLLIFLLLLAACQTPPKPAPVSVAPTTAPTPTPTPAAPVAESVLITADKEGFSPLAEAPHNQIQFTLQGLSKPALKTWKVILHDSQAGIVKTFEGDAASFQKVLSWDGKKNAADLAPEGQYYAEFVSTYEGQTETQQASSKNFYLDSTVPTGTVTVSPNPVVVDNQELSITLQVTPQNASTKIISWRLQILDPKEILFKDFISEAYKDGTIVWNGRADSNGQLTPGTEYTAAVTFVDAWGIKGTVKTSFTVKAAAPAVVKTELKDFTIYFESFSSDLKKGSAEQISKNSKILDRWANKLKEEKDTSVTLLGYANKVYWKDSVKGQIEETSELVPLSKARAEAVKQALINRGVDPAKLTAEAKGSQDPVVPFSEGIKTWKNRRVELKD